MAANGEDGTPQHVSYFVTVRTFNCKTVFDDETRARTLVDMIESVRRRSGLKKFAYVVLPDHYHLLLGGSAESSPVADAILAINRMVERYVDSPDDGQPLWDSEADVLVLYSPQAHFEKLNYIHNKPVLCGIAAKPEDYMFSSAGFYFRRYGKTHF